MEELKKALGIHGPGKLQVLARGDAERGHVYGTLKPSDPNGVLIEIRLTYVSEGAEIKTP